jgi:hypothetical protein
MLGVVLAQGVLCNAPGPKQVRKQDLAGSEAQRKFMKAGKFEEVLPIARGI